MSRPDDIQGYEEFAETIALFEEGDRIIYDPAPEYPGLIPPRAGAIRWRRWKLGGRCWGYAIDLDPIEGVEGHNGTMAIESSLRAE